ncbi:MAG: acyltransferase [Salaquimonas sp.]
MRTPAEKIEIIELLRAIAVTFVVVSHISYELLRLLSQRGTAFNDKLFPGDFGVDLFFVISGFVMVFTCWNKFGQGFEVANFIRKRIIRIVPLYWLLTTAMIGVVIFLPSGVNSATSNWQQWISSYFFIPYARETDGLIRPVLGLGWSLQFEMFFYSLFAICLFFKRAVGLVIVLVLLISFPLFGAYFDQSITLVEFVSHPIIWEFGIGIILGSIYMSGHRIPNLVGFSLVIVGLLLLISAPTYSALVDRMRHIHYGIPALLIMAGSTLTVYGNEMMISRIFQIGGEISYAVYLSHPFVIGVFALAFNRFEFLHEMEPLSLVFTFASSVLLSSMIAGYLLHNFIDLKITRKFASLWPAYKGPSAAPVALQR